MIHDTYQEDEISSEFFALTAQLAVAIAGFSGVVVALESRDVRSWDPLRRRDLRVLLQLSALALLFSLGPLAAYRLVDQASFWKWALGFYGLAHLLDVSTFLFRQPERARTGPVYVGVAFALAQIILATAGANSTAETGYMVSLIWHLGGATMGFVFLVWGKRSELSS
jgi:hypothetical protein